ncbi:MAG: hypothetical protein ACON47_01435 [Flavobacteriaceae bacterium]
MKIKRWLFRLVSLWSLLLIPFIGGFISQEIQWGVLDYGVAASLLGMGLLMIEILQLTQLSKKWKGLFMSLWLIFLFLLWAELAVGLFGSPIAGS